MNDKLLNILACPVCYKPLYFIKERRFLFCRSDGLYFQIRNKMPILLKNKSKSCFVEHLI